MHNSVTVKSDDVDIAAVDIVFIKDEVDDFCVLFSQTPCNGSDFASSGRAAENAPQSGLQYGAIGYRTTGASFEASLIIL